MAYLTDSRRNLLVPHAYPRISFLLDQIGGRGHKLRRDARSQQSSDQPFKCSLHSQRLFVARDQVCKSAELQVSQQLRIQLHTKKLQLHIPSQKHTRPAPKSSNRKLTEEDRTKQENPSTRGEPSIKSSPRAAPSTRATKRLNGLPHKASLGNPGTSREPDQDAMT